MVISLDQKQDAVILLGKENLFILKGMVITDKGDIGLEEGQKKCNEKWLFDD